MCLALHVWTSDLGLCVHRTLSKCVCSQRRKVTQTRLPVTSWAPLSFTLSPHPHPGPFLATALFANTLSSSPRLLWPPAQSKVTTQSWIKCHSLPGPYHPPQGPCCGLLGVAWTWEGGVNSACGVTPKTLESSFNRED